MSLLHKDGDKSAKASETAPKATDKSLDEKSKPTVDNDATSLVQIEGDSSPKKVTTLQKDVTKDPAIAGIEFTIQVPVANTHLHGQTYDEIVANLQSEILQFTEKHNIGAVNFRNKKLKKFVNDEVEARAEDEHEKAAG